MPEVEINCPSCKRQGMVKISDELLKNATRGLLAIDITKIFCDHSFVAYIDKNLSVRDYFNVDYKVELPEFEIEQNYKEKKFVSVEQLNLSQVKLHLPGLLLSYILKAIFLKKKIIVLSDESFLYNHGQNFFKYIMQNSFDFDLDFIPKDNFTVKKEIYKNHIVFEDIDIIQDKNKIMSPKRLYIEKFIVNKFLSKLYSNSSLIILKNDVQRIYYLTKVIVEKIQDHEGKKLHSIDLIHDIKEHYNVKISQQFLNCLLEIAKNYFNIEFPNRLIVSFF